MMTVSGQSLSMSGNASSPSSRSELTMATTPPPSDNTFLRLNNLGIGADGVGSPVDAAGTKKKRKGQRAVGAGGDKVGRGLRQFSVRVCEKVESKGRTTYNEVADELVAEFADPGDIAGSPDQYDEKNIRRRVYDALNVLMAMDIISKDKKEIQWRGLPHTSTTDIEELKAEREGLRNRVEKKAAYLMELEEQFIGLENLVKRNERLYSYGESPSGGVALPFILVQTRPHATVEVEISEDMQLVHFDFNSTPFELHDDNYVLKAMNLAPKRHAGAQQSLSLEEGRGLSISGLHHQQQSQQVPSHHPSTLNIPSSRCPTSSPLPGILKARLKHE